MRSCSIGSVAVEWRPADEKGRKALKQHRLIVNADGFGFGPGATQGILDAIDGGGPITSVSVNANFPDAERVRELVAKHPTVSIGVHVNPVAGAPCLPADKVPTLVGPDGQFHGEDFRRRWKRGSISVQELESEFNAQIGRVRGWVNASLTHLDSHQNSHLYYFDVFRRLVRKWRVPFIRNNASLIGLEDEHPARARFRAYLRKPHVAVGHAYRRLQMRQAARSGIGMADRLITFGYAGIGKKWERGNWERMFRNLRTLPPLDYEIYCHPAYPDGVLTRWATYTEPRRQELELLRTPELRTFAQASGIVLISFFDLLEK